MGEGRLVRGMIRGYDSGSKSATVELAGSPAFYVAGVPVSRGIADGEVVAGRWCVVAWMGTDNPTEAMVIGVY